MGREQGDVIGGCHKIYVAFTVEQVVKCNYRGWWVGGWGWSTHRRAAAQRADWQEGKETSDQGLFIHTVSSFVPASSFLSFICLSVTGSRPINQLKLGQVRV